MRRSWTLLLGAVVSSAALIGCDEKKGEGEGEAPPSRFAAVKSERAGNASASFCEKSFPSGGDGARKWSAPPERAVPAGGARAAAGPAGAGKGWTWVNLWASWCGPCLKEMPLLERWGESLQKEGLAVRFELWSVDESEQDLAGALKRPMPGRVRWLKSADDLPALIEGLGVDKGSAIPIHALVDPAGMVRCVRVGSVGEEVYGTVKAILAGG